VILRGTWMSGTSTSKPAQVQPEALILRTSRIYASRTSPPELPKLVPHHLNDHVHARASLLQ
jgi:hypothetical protein